MRQARKRPHRSRKDGFVLVAIILFGFFAVSMIAALFPLIDNIMRSESTGRNMNELRAAAEIGVDYGIQQLNEYAVSDPGQISPLVDAASIPVPARYLTGFKDGTVFIRIKSISKTDWQSIAYESSIYSPSLDTANPISMPTPVQGDYWRVIESTAKRGMWTKSVRVFLEPMFNLSASEIATNGGTGNTTSYFNNPIFSRSRIDLSQISGPLTISSSQDTGTPYGLTVATNGTIDLSNAGSVIEGNTIANLVTTVGPITAQVLGQANPQTSTLKPAPVPEAGPASPLSNDSIGTILQPGSYQTPGVVYDGVTNSATVNTTAPVKIFIQDGITDSTGMLPSYAANITASALNNTSIEQLDGSGGARNLQIWYAGQRPISLNLDTDFNGLIYAPNSTITLTGSGTFKGGLVGDTVKMKNSGTVDIDTRLNDAAEKAVSGSGLTYATNSSGAVFHGYKAVTWQEVQGQLVP